jgi:hypothetical protein
MFLLHRAHSMELTLLLNLEGNKLKESLPKVISLIDRYIWSAKCTSPHSPFLLALPHPVSIAKEYSVKNQMIHFLTFTLVLQLHSVDSTMTEKEKEIERETPVFRNPTEKLIVDRFAAYLADGDKLFVLSVIDALLNLNGQCPLLL